MDNILLILVWYVPILKTKAWAVIIYNNSQNKNKNLWFYSIIHSGYYNILYVFYLNINYFILFSDLKFNFHYYSGLLGI